MAWIEDICFELYSDYKDFWLHIIINKENFFFLQEKKINNWKACFKFVSFTYHSTSVFCLVMYSTRFISTWSYENRVSKHFVIFLNFPCLIACLLCCLLMLLFLACFVVRDLCRSGCRQNYYLTPPPYFFLTHNSLLQSWFRCRLAV